MSGRSKQAHPQRSHNRTHLSPRSDRQRGLFSSAGLGYAGAHLPSASPIVSASRDLRGPPPPHHSRLPPLYGLHQPLRPPDQRLALPPSRTSPGCSPRPPLSSPEADGRPKVFPRAI